MDVHRTQPHIRSACPSPLGAAGAKQPALTFELWDAAGDCGAGTRLAAGSVALPALQGLKEREEQTADVQLGQVCVCLLVGWWAFVARVLLYTESLQDTPHTPAYSSLTTLCLLRGLLLHASYTLQHT